MLRSLFNRFIVRRHYWRNVGFDELSELYTSMMFRSLAMSLAGIFIPIYLYQHGFQIWEILLFYAMVYIAYTLVMPWAALLIAKVGPKHTMVISYVFQILSLAGLIELSRYSIPLWAIAILMGFSLSLFFTAFHIDFSKIKHSDHGGKEVSWMYSMQKIGAVLGPLVGGAVAYFFGSQYTFFAALVMFCLGIVPLLMTREPMRTNQKLDFKHLTFNEIKYDIISWTALSIETGVSLIIWPLFVGVFIFQDNPYIKLGGAASISIVLSLVVARMIGRMIDRKQGRALLRFGAFFNAVTHLFRTSVSGFFSVLALNIVNEGVTIAYVMPFTKGMYDAADQHPGYRIVYITAMEACSAVGRAVLFLAASLAAYTYSSGKGFFFCLFVVGAICSLLLTLERFKALDK